MRGARVFQAITWMSLAAFVLAASPRPARPPTVDGNVNALCEHGGALIVGGHFPRAAAGTGPRSIARWDGASLTQVGSGLDGEVHAVCEWKGELFAAGLFGAGAPANLVRWDGRAWQRVAGFDTVGAGGTVYAVAPSRRGLYVAASSDRGAGVVARYDGARWQVLGGAIPGVVRCLAVWRGRPIIGGYFTEIGGEPAAAIAQWDGARWLPLGAGFNGPVYALATWRGRLVAGGSFDHSDKLAVAHIAAWDGRTWHAIGGGAPGPVAALLGGDRLGAGGYFGRRGGEPAPGTLWWDGASWREGEGAPSSVQALARYRGAVVAGRSGEGSGLHVVRPPRR